MIELLDPKNIDPVAYENGVLQDICEYSLLPDKRIGWNYCLDYIWIVMQCEGLFKPGMVIIDIGCGPGAIHGYLENKYGVEIIGIDMHRWEKDYVDILGDFSDTRFRKEHGFTEESIDCVLSISAFEHNKRAKHRHVVEVCLNCLKQEGRLISTFAASKERMSYFKPSKQWNLSHDDIYSIYDEPVENFSDYDEIWQRWHDHKTIPGNYKERYGSWGPQTPSFLSVGANILKRKTLKENNKSLFENILKRLKPEKF